MRPEDAEVACGAAKIDRPAPAAPSGETSTGADTSKTLRRSSFVLSEVRAVYVREARTLKTGPPAASRTVRGDGSFLAPGASALSGWPARAARCASAACRCAARSFGTREIRGDHRRRALCGRRALTDRHVGQMASRRRQA